MKATVKMYKNDGSSDDHFPIKLIVSHRSRSKRKTIAHSRIRDWDENLQMPKVSHRDFENLYGRVMEIREIARTMEFSKMEDLAGAMNFFEEKTPINKSFYDFAAKQIAKMKQLGRAGNADAYQCAIDQLEKFAPFLDFDQITMEFLERFKETKKLDGLKNTSVRTYLYEIRAIYNSAVRLGMCEDARPFRGLFYDLPVQKRRMKNEYLDESGMVKLKNISGVSKEQQLAVDLSLLQFYFCGADLCDVYYLKKSQIVGDRVYLQRTKLGAKGYEFDVLIVPEAMAIIRKYMAIDGEYLFPWKKGETSYKTFRSTHNTKLKRIQRNAGIELMPRGGNLTSKVLRHSFATMAKFKNVDVDVIRELMGHERGDIDTVYKDKYPISVRNNSQMSILGCIIAGLN